MSALPVAELRGPDGITAALRPISLDELVGRAELLSRVDRKYLLAPSALGDFVTALAGDQRSVTRVLELDGQRQFGYRSVYFDTEDLQLHRQAGQGRRHRCKVRTRHYLDSGQVWLEVKSRGFRGTNLKQRIELPDGDPAELGPAGTAFVADIVAEQRIVDVDVASLAPTLWTAYRRITLHHRDVQRALECRITIDTELAFAAPEPGRPTPATWQRRPGTAIVEVKAGPATLPAEWALWRLGSRPARISKYGAGLAIACPATRHLKWHRTVERLNQAEQSARKDS